VYKRQRRTDFANQPDIPDTDPTPDVNKEAEDEIAGIGTKRGRSKNRPPENDATDLRNSRSRSRQNRLDRNKISARESRLRKKLL
jgi:hypothetical protein